MTSQTQITCAIWREQMMKRMTCRANLFKEFIIRTVNEVINGNKTIYATKSPEALKEGIDSIFLIQHLKSLSKLGERIAYVKQ